MQLSLIFLLLQLWGNLEVSLSQNACSRLPDVPHAHVSEETKKSEYQDHDVIHFTCEPGYISDETSKYVCMSQGWLTVQQETCYSCLELPDVPHATISEETKKAEYQEGDVIHFTCEPGYISGPTIKYVCTSRGWLAVRQGTCYIPVSSCDAPPAEGGITVKGLPENDDLILPNHVLIFSCDGPGKFLNGSSVLICGKDGQWDKPFPSCRAPLGCRNPPHLADGDTRITAKLQYRHNERVEYICQRYYTMEGGPYKTCNNGEWTEEMRCLKPCIVDEEVMRTHNIAFRYTYQKKLYSSHDDEMEFKCTGRRIPISREGMRQKCLDGVMHLPTCI